jgi:hypothetical protein
MGQMIKLVLIEANAFVDHVNIDSVTKLSTGPIDHHDDANDVKTIIADLHNALSLVIMLAHLELCTLL